MSNPATLASAQLKRKLRESFEKEQLGASGILSELHALAQSCAATESGSKRVVAFVLSELFRALSEDRSERPVTADENEAVRREYEHLSRAALFISGEAGDAIAICDQLVASYLRLLLKR